MRNDTSANIRIAASSRDLRRRQYQNPGLFPQGVSDPRDIVLAIHPDEPVAQLQLLPEVFDLVLRVPAQLRESAPVRTRISRGVIARPMRRVAHLLNPQCLVQQMDIPLHDGVRAHIVRQLQVIDRKRSLDVAITHRVDPLGLSSISAAPLCRWQLSRGRSPLRSRTGPRCPWRQVWRSAHSAGKQILTPSQLAPVHPGEH